MYVFQIYERNSAIRVATCIEHCIISSKIPSFCFQHLRAESRGEAVRDPVDDAEVEDLVAVEDDNAVEDTQKNVVEVHSWEEDRIVDEAQEELVGFCIWMEQIENKILICLSKSKKLDMKYNNLRIIWTYFEGKLVILKLCTLSKIVFKFLLSFL